MAENKTTPTAVSVDEFLARVVHPTRRADGERLLELMSTITGQKPVMWGPSIVGFGRYHYRYDSGHQGDAAAVGFSPRKASLSLYGLINSPEGQALLPALGKHKVGAGCLYINKLADIDEEVLKKMIGIGYEYVTTALHQP
ncbi:DUF1801 domain-containing protein [Pseudarthrobacter sp. J1738]|uniref:DUF1801 domain-containing protein n=1 Tax=unclassified Pseudarthrobacter TaxID=2647000 RepID=UPI003D2CBC16